MSDHVPTDNELLRVALEKLIGEGFEDGTGYCLQCKGLFPNHEDSCEIGKWVKAIKKRLGVTKIIGWINPPPAV